MRVVLQPALAGRKTVNIMTKRKKQHSPEQIVSKIQQADRILAEGGDVAAVLMELNITEATYYRWRNHYGGLKAEDPKKLKQLEKQNLALKKLLAEVELEKPVLKELAEQVF
jgi:putative transposase